MSQEVRTSHEWARDLKRGVHILDPDGWDRKNFHHSWFIELITKKEFEKRVSESTCELPKKGGIWKS